MGQVSAYFDRPLPMTLIFGSFFVIFLPLCVLSVVPNFFEALPYLLLAEVVGLGVTHFFITLALYGQQRNLSHFSSSTKNRLIYFVAPALILLLFALVGAFELREREAALALYFFGAIRFFDFFHVGRQSFGMLQLFKRPVAGALPDWSRRTENAFFIGMALLQWETFLLGGRFQGDALYARLPAVAMGALFVSVAASYLQLPADGSRRRGLRPLCYFTMQAICAAAAVYDTRLYAVGLTMHYVEYHVIMAPRCFRVPLQKEATVDRAYRPLRDNAVLFYVLLLAVVLVFESRNYVASDLPTSTAFFVHIFDGIFFVHYFIEAFLWKFKEPFYGETLGPLYFPHASEDATEEPKEPQRGRAGARPAWKSLGVVAAVLAVLGLTGVLGGGLETLERRVVAPMDAENHVRWAVRLSEDGKRGEARTHAEHALSRVPGYEPAISLLAALDAAQSSSDTHLRGGLR